MRARPTALLLLAALVLFGLLWLDEHPLRLATRGDRVEAGYPRQNDGHGVLLIAAAPAGGSDAGQRVFDLEWVNILGQNFGGCDVLPPSALLENPEARLAGRSLVVLPRSTLESLDPMALPLRNLVEAGLWVILERAPDRWAEFSGVLPREVLSRDTLPWPESDREQLDQLAPGSALRAATNSLPGPDHELSLPLELVRHRPPEGTSGVRPWSALRGEPIAWRRTEGQGGWLSLSLHLARLSSELRQGIPDAGHRLPHRYDDILPGPGETNDLVACRELLQADHAWLDAWLASLLGPGSGPTPWPTLWPAPFDDDGWMLITHDDEGFGDKSRWMTEEQAAAGVPSTIFLMPSDGRLSAGGARGLQEDGADLGLHPWLPSDHLWKEHRAPKERLGFWKFQPVGRMPSVMQQRDELAALLPGSRAPRFNRTHFLLWTDEVDQLFEELVAAGFRADSSFGPDWGAAGWLFGSTAPFRPLAANGNAHAIWELPFLSAETIGGVDGARVARWMRTNARGGHGPITLLFHPDAFGWIPSVQLFELWERLPSLAREQRHRPASMGQFLGFWERRARTRLHWRWNGDELIVDVVGDAEPGEEPLAIALPIRWQDQTLAAWEADWPGAATRHAESYGQAVRLIRLPLGHGTLSASYR